MVSIDNIISTMKVLYVESDKDLQIIMKMLLNKKTKNVFIADNGREGFETFNIYKPDIIITDIKIPILNGLDMIKEIRSLDQDCGIIVTTELDDLDSILTSIDIGIDKYMLKPIDEERLNNAVNIVLNKMFKRQKYNKFFNALLELGKDDKRAAEENIKSQFSTFLKKNTGKGPKFIKIISLENTIEIKACEVLTTIEKTYMQDEKNFNLIKYSRRFLYESKRTELEEIVGSITKLKVKVKEVNINLLENEDRIVFAYCFNS